MGKKRNSGNERIVQKSLERRKFRDRRAERNLKVSPETTPRSNILCAAFHVSRLQVSKRHQMGSRRRAKKRERETQQKLNPIFSYIFHPRPVPSFLSIMLLPPSLSTQFLSELGTTSGLSVLRNRLVPLITSSPPPPASLSSRSSGRFFFFFGPRRPSRCIPETERVEGPRQGKRVPSRVVLQCCCFKRSNHH